jgi:aspartyl-tRNA(Asn)/glutamyl-tRNA(Gln) amidotransferase subunit A
LIYIDDSILQKGKPATAGSKILEGYVAPYDAEAVTRLGGETAQVRLGEFGLEPPDELPDGTLLCNDDFGHIRILAAKRGLYTLRPTYGTVSRYGLIPTACSMDQICIVCGDLAEGFSLLEKIAGKDEKDGAMFPETNCRYDKPDAPVRLHEGALPYAELYQSVLNILAFAEISGNLSRYDGVKLGFRAEGYTGLDGMYIKTRSEGFGLAAKLAVLMGCLVLSKEHYDALYDKAMRIRRLIRESLPFDRFDVLALPVDNPLPVLAGLPSLTFGSVQLAANVKNEGVLLKAMEAVL